MLGRGVLLGTIAKWQLSLSLLLSLTPVASSASLAATSAGLTRFSCKTFVRYVTNPAITSLFDPDFDTFFLFPVRLKYVNCDTTPVRYIVFIGFIRTYHNSISSSHLV